MKLSFIIDAAGFTADEIKTQCTISLENGTITNSHLVTNVKVPGMTKEKFDQCAEEAKQNCPVSKALSMNITLEANLA